MFNKLISTLTSVGALAVLALAFTQGSAQANQAPKTLTLTSPTQMVDLCQTLLKNKNTIKRDTSKFTYKGKEYNFIKVVNFPFEKAAFVEDSYVILPKKLQKYSLEVVHYDFVGYDGWETFKGTATLKLPETASEFAESYGYFLHRAQLKKAYHCKFVAAD